MKVWVARVTTHDVTHELGKFFKILKLWLTSNQVVCWMQGHPARIRDYGVRACPCGKKFDVEYGSQGPISLNIELVIRKDGDKYITK